MTLAPAHAVTQRPDGTAAAVVTAVLVLRDAGPWLAETLDSLAGQTRPPERLLVVDCGTDGEAVEQVRAHGALAEAVGAVHFLTVPPGLSLGESTRRALAADPADPADPTADGPPAEHLWLLTSDCVADPHTLARLLDAVRSSPAVAVAGPKLVLWDRPGALHSVGLQVTRAGRLVPSPVHGEPDQGQYDRRTDTVAVPFPGMLVERSLLEGLGGHDPAFGEFGADLDLGWRAQQAGRRVVVVPRATLRTGAAPAGEGHALPRRDARRVALARCALWAAPFLALWVALTSAASGLALLLAKRPRAAAAELGDAASLLTPWRPAAARWRSRGTRVLRRRDLRGLFVRPGAALRHTTDLLRDEIVPDRGDLPLAHTPVEAIETGPVADEAVDLHALSASWVARAVGNPGVLAVALAALVSVVSGRHLAGGFFGRLEDGLSGGELLGTRAGSATLWQTWLDSWHGAGTGHSGEQSPHLAVLAALAWVGEHLPGVEPAASPVGAAVALLFGLAFPLATLSAYLASRVVTRSPWPRALAALAWSTGTALTTAVGGGRLGAVVAAVLLPPVAAGVALAARRRSTVTATAATVLAAAVLGSFVPAFLVVFAAAALALLVLGRGRAPRLRGLALLVVPPALLGPWLLALADAPHLLLSGPGLAVWGQGQALPWEIALLHPGGPGSYPVLFSAPLVLAGLAGLARTGRRSPAGTLLAVLGLTGLALALAAPRVLLGTVPDGQPGAGEPITAWAGTGLLLYALALVAAALLGAEGLPVRRAAGGWAALARWPLGLAVVVGVLAGAGWTAWTSVGAELSSWSDPRPAVAIDQAESPLANRMLVLEPQGDRVAFELLGREVSAVARDLPLTAGQRPRDPALADAVGRLFELGAPPDVPSPARALAAHAVGFVGLRAEDSDPRIRTLDATAGLSRLGEHQGMRFWRVLPPLAPVADGTLAPSRLRLAQDATETTVPVTGEHAQTSTRLTVAAGTSLVVAEPRDWAAHARVSFGGAALQPDPDAAQPTYALPAGEGQLEVDLPPTHQPWRWAQLALVALLAFLALPVGLRHSRRRA